MSFAGGGSDIPSFYRKHGGAVLSTAIDKYIYVTVSEKFDQSLRVSYSKTEQVESADLLEHHIVRETMKMLHMSGGIEITSVADIPSHGTGLGSSSSFTVGLLNSLHAYQGRHVSADELGAQSCDVELVHCKEPIGKQDQYAAAFGGLNFIRFNPDDTVCVDPIICPRGTLHRLESELIVFYTGITRSASKILGDQGKAMSSQKSAENVMKAMVKLAYDLKSEFQRSNTSSFGDILHEGWLLKKSLAKGISTPQIDDWYSKARKAGAAGGKLLGAGSGGFMIFQAPVERHESIRFALSDMREIKFGFEPQGSRIIFVR
jgi:D-glycero-alpha-D-manno-heptose-7-phosphate kinase